MTLWKAIAPTAPADYHQGMPWVADVRFSQHGDWGYEVPRWGRRSGPPFLLSG